MQALLLNSGIGKRMEHETFNKPKCMVEIAQGETIISRQVRQLLNQGIDDFIITTGPFAELLQNHLATTFPGCCFTYVPNPAYDTTNYIYSMLLAKDRLQEDFLLLHGDLVFDEALLAKTIASPHADTVLVSPDAPLPEKDFKARLSDGLVREISIDIFGEDCAFLIPLYKISRNLWQQWLLEIENFAARGELGVYAENALNCILDKQSLYPIHFGQELCTEIDNLHDLETVRTILAAT